MLALNCCRGGREREKESFHLEIISDSQSGRLAAVKLAVVSFSVALIKGSNKVEV